MEEAHAIMCAYKQYVINQNQTKVLSEKDEYVVAIVGVFEGGSGVEFFV